METKTADGTEREGNAILETKVSQTSAKTRRARCVPLSRPRSTLNFSRGQPVGGGSGAGSIPLRPRPSSPLFILVERVSDIEALAFRSNDYSRNDGSDSDWKALLLNKVVVGNGMKLIRDDTSLTKPPAGYDSVSFFGG